MSLQRLRQVFSRVWILLASRGFCGKGADEILLPSSLKTTPSISDVSSYTRTLSFSFGPSLSLLHPPKRSWCSGVSAWRLLNGPTSAIKKIIKQFLQIRARRQHTGFVRLSLNSLPRSAGGCWESGPARYRLGESGERGCSGGFTPFHLRSSLAGPHRSHGR